MMRTISRAFCLAGGLALVAACSGPDPSQTRPAAPTGDERDTEIKHEACDKDAPTARRVDVNGDGLPDIVHVMKGTREV
ncbi:MAG TPA: hypothetical protein VLS89_05795, partial [Candidatus Nanopelagicales bacterium]|nr:hypothetical protein [Candidatus Nanopelagicales bacterium]